MADKKNLEPEVKATAELAPPAPTGITDARAQRLVELGRFKTVEEAKQSESERLAAKKPKAAA